jgi:hypothetical protein
MSLLFRSFHASGLPSVRHLAQEPVMRTMLVMVTGQGAKSFSDASAGAWSETAHPGLRL